MRERTTTRRRSRGPMASKDIMAEIEQLERQLEADADTELEKETDAIVKEEVKIVNEGSPVKVTEPEDQNEMAMDNWPVENREAVASRLLKLASALLGSDD